MIEALLDIIRQENAPLNESIIIINEIIEDVVDDLTIIAKKNDISIYVEIDKISSSGMGLGLSLTKSVINMHGGEIKVESEVNKGTKFMIILPINI